MFSFLLLVFLNSSFVLNLVLGYVLGILLRKNLPGLMELIQGEEEETMLHKNEDNPFANVDQDVIAHLKTLGLDMKVQGEDADYLKKLWESMIGSRSDN
ncbi:hypothetical protein HHB58_11170 [Neisseria meningitidis]|nr:hypothetical protein [Neisseria meningitidis]